MPNELPIKTSLVSGAVLAGGLSSRMGRDKAFIEIEGTPLVALQARRLFQAGCAEVIISGHPNVTYPVPEAKVVFDQLPGLGPMAGLSSVLQAASNSFVLVIAVDLPDLTSTWLSHLASCPDYPSGTVFRHQGHFEPLAALYPRSMAQLCREHLLHKQLSLQRMLSEAISLRLMTAHDLPETKLHQLRNWNS